MRFVYIDTKGKEVPIPTVDALALRIELGAITETTRLFDEAANRWAPAGEHEVFRSLVREQQERTGGFVAPPPPTAAVAAPPTPQVSTVPEPLEPEPAAPPVEPELPPLPRGPNPFDVLEGPTVAPEASPAPAAAKAPAATDPFGPLGFDLTLEPADPTPTLPDFDNMPGAPELMGDAPSPGTDARERQDPDTFDFGGIGGLLTEDEDDGDADSQEAAPPEPGLAIEDAL